MEFQAILSKAMEMEASSRDQYKWLEERSLHSHTRKTLRQLAAEEQSHLDLLLKFAAQPETRPWPEEGQADSLYLARDKWGAEAKALDRIWSRYMDALEDVRESILPHSDELSALEKARELERVSEELYQSAAATGPEAGRELFNWLVRAERRHYNYVSKLLAVAVALNQEFPETRPDL